MPGRLPAGIRPGRVYRHARYYRDAAGDWKVKYLLVLAGTPGSDVVYRLLTSRAHGRPRSPPCWHGDPYPGFYLGRLGGPLSADSWLSLQQADDFDGPAFLAALRDGLLAQVADLPLALLCPAMDCAATADDTTRQQEGCIRDARTVLGCP
jgi:hypothetical protein